MPEHRTSNNFAYANGGNESTTANRGIESGREISVGDTKSNSGPIMTKMRKLIRDQKHLPAQWPRPKQRATWGVDKCKFVGVQGWR